MQAWRRLDVADRYTLADAVFSGLLVTPLAVLFTVGTEAIIRRVSIDHAPLTTSVLLLLAAIAMQFAAGYHQRDIAAWISRQPEVCAEAAARVYIYVYAIANVCHYTALDELFDAYAESDDDGGLQTALKLLVSSIVVLAGLRCCRNVIGPPLYVAIDTEGTESVVETSTLFGVEAQKTTQGALDILATVIAVETSVVLHWIALWRIYDVIIFPQHDWLSALISWAVGYAVVTMAVYRQSDAIEMSKRLEDDPLPVKRLVFEDAYIMAANAGCVLVWRGWWLFFEGIIYYFPAYCRDGVSDCSLSYAHFLPFVLLSLCYTSATLLSKGVDRDGEATHGEGVRFPIQFFSVYFSEDIARATEDDSDAGRQNRETARSTTRAGRQRRFSPAREDTKYPHSRRYSPRRSSPGSRLVDRNSFTRRQTRFED